MSSFVSNLSIHGENVPESNSQSFSSILKHDIHSKCEIELASSSTKYQEQSQTVYSQTSKVKFKEPSDPSKLRRCGSIIFWYEEE